MNEESNQRKSGMETKGFFLLFVPFAPPGFPAAAILAFVEPRWCSRALGTAYSIEGQ
jgi:hypothetical protein